MVAPTRLTAAVLLLAATAACGGTSDDERHPFTGEGEYAHAAGGVNGRVGDVLLRDVSIDEPDGGPYEAGDVARLRITLFNQAEHPDALVAVASPVAQDTGVLVDHDCDGTPEQVGEVDLPASAAVRTPSTSVPDGPEVDYLLVVRLDQQVRGGSSVPVTFTFRQAGATTLQVPVELPETPLRTDGATCTPSSA